MKNLLIIIILILTSTKVISQSKYLTSDTTKFRFEYDPISKDTIFTFIDYTDNFKTWNIYFDNNFSKLAYYSYLKKDTLFINEYYRNSVLKKQNIYLIKDVRKLIYASKFYSNGQIEYGENPNDTSTLLKIVRYHENGKTKWLSYYHNEYGGHGEWKLWYPNGQLELDAYLFKNEYDGQWTYYKPDGSVEKVEKWKAGKLLETIKHSN
jgi:antitoxin component YwqK of YwqJK toxin-antitoxin module